MAEEDRLAHVMGTLALNIVGSRLETVLQHQLACPGSFALRLHDDPGVLRGSSPGCGSATTPARRPSRRGNPRAMWAHWWIGLGSSTSS